MIQYKGGLKKLELQNRLIKSISEKIKCDFVNLVVIKNDIELINEICNAIEDAVKYAGVKKTNKLELFLNIYEAVFGVLSEDDKKALAKMVEYLHAQGKIKARTLLKYLFDKLKGFFLNPVA